MPYYEVLCLASGRLTRKELGDLVTRTTKNFMSLGAVMTRLYGLGAVGHGPRKLAYRIRQNQVNYETGYFVNFCGFASPAALKEISRKLSLEDSVLRTLAVRKPVADCLLEPPNIDETLPGTGMSEDDPAFALHEFLRDYGKEFPDGQRVVASSDVKPDGIVDGKGDAAVQAVLSSLRASANSQSFAGKPHGSPDSKSDPGLKWLLDYEGKPNPSS